MTSSKLCIAGLFARESTSHRWIFLTKGHWCGKHFHVMTSLWYLISLSHYQNQWSPTLMTPILVIRSLYILICLWTETTYNLKPLFCTRNSNISINASPPEQNGRHFADDIFRCIFVNEIHCISIKISLGSVPKSPIDNHPALVWIMAWHQIGANHYLNQCWPSSPTHICGTRVDESNTNFVIQSVACLHVHCPDFNGN